MASDRLYCIAGMSAYLHGAIGIIGTIAFMVILCVIGARDMALPEEYEDGKNLIMAYFICFLVYFVVLLILTVPMFIGIGKGKPKKMLPFICWVLVGICLLIIGATRHFIWGLCHEGPFGKLFVIFITNLICAGIQALILVPIYLLYRKYRNGTYEPRETLATSSEALKRFTITKTTVET